MPRRDIPLGVKILFLLLPLCLIPIGTVGALAYWYVAATIRADLAGIVQQVPGPLGGSISQIAAERLSNLNRSALLLGGAMVAVALIGSGLIARTVGRSLAPLTRGTERLARGDFDVRLPVTRRDELGHLAQAFNMMAASLAAYRDDVVRAENAAAFGRLASVVAHEVRNPLNAIRGSIDYLRLKRPGDELVARYASVIGAEIDTLDAFVGDFLRLAKLQPPQLRPVDLPALLRARLDLHAPAAETHGIALTLDVPRGLPPVSVDPVQMASVLENLVNNAFEAMPHGGTLRIRATPEIDGVTIVVADTGGGMSDAVSRQVLTPFFTTKPGGSGLGLAISRRIVELHGGSLTFTTREGAGTSFVIRLPQAAAQAPAG